MSTTSKRLVIFNTLIVTMNKSFDIIKGDIFIEDGIIKSIGKVDPREWTKRGIYEIMYASDKIALPGLIQTHTHLCQSLFRGLAENLSLLDWLYKKIFPLESAHNENSMRAAARLGIAELLLGGTTTILDMGSVHFQDVIFEEARNLGIRFIGGKCLLDSSENIPPNLIQKDPLNDALEQSKRWHNSCDKRLQYTLAPRSILSCSEDLLRNVAEAAKKNNFLIHTHCAENLDEENLVKQKTGRSSIMTFYDFGLLSNKTNLAHCIYLSESDIKILKETEANITHCPTSNLKLGSGIARIVKYIKEGINTSLGCDSVACNNRLSILHEMHIAGLLQNYIDSPHFLIAKNILQLATTNAARALNLSNDIGSIEVGKKADIILLNADTINNFGDSDVYTKLVFSPNDSIVDTVIVDGKVLILNHKPVHFDEKSIISIAKNELANLLRRANI